MAEKREMAKWQTPKFNIRPEIVKLFFFWVGMEQSVASKGAIWVFVISAHISANPQASHKKKRLPYRIRLDAASRSAFVCALRGKQFFILRLPHPTLHHRSYQKNVRSLRKRQKYINMITVEENCVGLIFWSSRQKGLMLLRFLHTYSILFLGHAGKKGEMAGWEAERSIVEFWFMCFESKRKSIMCVYAWHCKYCFVLQSSDWIRRIWDWSESFWWAFEIRSFEDANN